jgi:hypothetical protein
MLYLSLSIDNRKAIVPSVPDAKQNISNRRAARPATVLMRIFANGRFT